MSETQARRILIACGVALTAAWAAISVLSTRFVWGVGHAERPIPLYLALYWIAFLVYAAAAAVALRVRGTAPRDLPILLAFALAMRAPVLLSNPIQESDFYRYQWDGQTLRMGINPYAFAPDDVKGTTSFESLRPEASADLERLRRMARADPDAAATLDRISHPHLPTLYPPLAQAVFAAAQWLCPWKLWGLRLIFLIADLAVVGMLWLTLKALGRPGIHALIYAWCPLVVKEGLNSAHVDIVTAAAMAALAWGMVRGRPAWVGAALAAAGLLKLGPLILVPIVAVWSWKKGRASFLRCAAAFLIALAAALLPFAGWRGTSLAGLGAFGAEWVSNASLFGVLATVLPDQGARIAVGLCGAAIAVVLAWRVSRSPQVNAAPSAALWALGALFCLAPTGNPWYLLWLLPFLSLSPWWCWIYLTGAVEVYYLGFYFDYRWEESTAREMFAQTKIWEYLPFYAWMVGEVLTVWRGRIRGIQ